MSATWSGGRARFLLEVALDRSRMKERLADALIQERTRRGNGDPRRFPQPKMAELLGYSLRQYQRLEDPEDGGLPSWENLDAIAERLGLNPADLFDDASAAKPVVEPEPDLRARLQKVEERLSKSEALLRRIAKAVDA